MSLHKIQLIVLILLSSINYLESIIIFTFQKSLIYLVVTLFNFKLPLLLFLNGMFIYF